MDRRLFLEIATRTIADCMKVCHDDETPHFYFVNNVQNHEPKIWFEHNQKCFDLISMAYDKQENTITLSGREWGNLPTRIIFTGKLSDLNFATIMSIVNLCMWRTIKFDY